MTKKKKLRKNSRHNTIKATKKTQSLGWDNGSNHPDSIFPAIPPSFDESMIYNQHVSMYLRLPMRIKQGSNMINRFWKDFQRRNRCNLKQVAKMICVLFSRKADRDILLSYISDNQSLWDNNNLSSPEKIIHFFKNVQIC